MAAEMSTPMRAPMMEAVGRLGFADGVFEVGIFFLGERGKLGRFDVKIASKVIEDWRMLRR